MTAVVRVGGVPEHFNLPWLVAMEEGDFDGLDVEVVWVDFPGGTGDIMAALEAGELDLATPLTEGAVVAIAQGALSRILSFWVTSPLLWAIHVAADSPVTAVDELTSPRFAISRIGSGSELMARVFAADRGVPLEPDDLVVVGGIDGAAEALTGGEADVFLWNRSMTQPYVDAGTFARIDEIHTPWPSFVVAVGPSMLGSPERAAAVAARARLRASRLTDQADAVDLISARYGLDHDTSAGWFAHVEWASGDSIETTALETVIAHMVELGRLAEAVPAENLLIG